MSAWLSEDTSLSTQPWGLRVSFIRHREASERLAMTGGLSGCHALALLVKNKTGTLGEGTRCLLNLELGRLTCALIRIAGRPSITVEIIEHGNGSPGAFCRTVG